MFEEWGGPTKAAAQASIYRGARYGQFEESLYGRVDVPNSYRLICLTQYGRDRIANGTVLASTVWRYATGQGVLAASWRPVTSGEALVETA